MELWLEEGWVMAGNTHDHGHAFALAGPIITGHALEGRLGSLLWVGVDLALQQSTVLLLRGATPQRGIHISDGERSPTPSSSPAGLSGRWLAPVPPRDVCIGLLVPVPPVGHLNRRRCDTGSSAALRGITQLLQELCVVLGLILLPPSNEALLGVL